MIQLRESITWSERGVSRYIFLRPPSTSVMRRKFISNEKFEMTLRSKSPERMLFDDILSKSDFIQTFEKVASLIDVRDGQTVLELGRVPWLGQRDDEIRFSRRICHC